MEALTKLLLTPGASQLYYGDESCRPLQVPGAVGDANLRSPMNWEVIASGEAVNGTEVTRVLEHARKLGRFRRDHPAVGAGKHMKLSDSPYLFSRILEEEGFEDRVVVGLELEAGTNQLEVGTVFPDGTRLYDYYSGTFATVRKGRVTIRSGMPLALLGENHTAP